MADSCEITGAVGAIFGLADQACGLFQDCWGQGHSTGVEEGGGNKGGGLLVAPFWFPLLVLLEGGRA